MGHMEVYLFIYIAADIFIERRFDLYVPPVGQIHAESNTRSKPEKML